MGSKKISTSAERACLLRGDADGAQPVELLLRRLPALGRLRDALLQAAEVLIRPCILLARTPASAWPCFCAPSINAKKSEICTSHSTTCSAGRPAHWTLPVSKADSQGGGHGLQHGAALFQQGGHVLLGAALCILCQPHQLHHTCLLAVQPWESAMPPISMQLLTPGHWAYGSMILLMSAGVLRKLYGGPPCNQACCHATLIRLPEKRGPA